MEKIVATQIPKSVKWIYSAFMAVLVPTYWAKHGPTNFLWFSDVTLILAFVAVLLENRLLANMAAISGLFFESFWIIDFLANLVFDIRISGLTGYMFDSELALWLRSLSLFHVAMPPLLLWLISRLGYDRRGLTRQLGFGCTVLLLTRLTTEPAENINWVYGYMKVEWLSFLGPVGYMILELLLVASVYVATDWFLRVISPKLQSSKH